MGMPAEWTEACVGDSIYSECAGRACGQYAWEAKRDAHLAIEPSRTATGQSTHNTARGCMHADAEINLVYAMHAGPAGCRVPAHSDHRAHRGPAASRRRGEACHCGWLWCHWKRVIGWAGSAAPIAKLGIVPLHSVVSKATPSC